MHKPGLYVIIHDQIWSILQEVSIFITFQLTSIYPLQGDGMCGGENLVEVEVVLSFTRGCNIHNEMN